MRWTVARLRAMPPVSRPSASGRPSMLDWARWVRLLSWHSVQRLSGGRVLTRDHAALLRRELPQEAATLVATAQRRAAGEFALLGYPPQLHARPIEWDTDRSTGSRWPRRHGLMTDYRHHPVGDPKWVWELNRLQHIPLLARGVACGGGRHARGVCHRRPARLDRVRYARVTASPGPTPSSRGYARCPWRSRSTPSDRTAIG